MITSNGGGGGGGGGVLTRVTVLLSAGEHVALERSACFNTHAHTQRVLPHTMDTRYTLKAHASPLWLMLENYFGFWGTVFFFYP